MMTTAQFNEMLFADDQLRHTVSLTTDEIVALDRIGAKYNASGDASDFYAAMYNLAVSKYDVSLFDVYTAWIGACLESDPE